MVDQKYLELIHKEIDNTISSGDKILLDKYIKTNPEAFAIHRELLETEKLLDKLPDNNPSASLKQRILDSIDFNRYAYKKKRSVAHYFSTAFSGPGKKLTASFAYGLVTGIIFLSVIFYAPFYNNNSDVNTVSGTIGLPPSEVLQSVKVNSIDIVGKIEISKAVNNYGVYIDLKSTQKYTLQIEFDQENLKIDGQSDNAPYSLLFSAKESYRHKFSFRIVRNNIKLFDHEIILSNR